MHDENELYELDKKTARHYRLHGVGVDRPDATVAVACDRHTDPKSLPFRARALTTTTTPPAAAVVADVWDALEFIERHELDAHGAVARPVPYLPVDATTELPVVPFGSVPHVSVVAVPVGTRGEVLPGLPLSLRHRSARPVVVRTIRLADGAHLVTLPADGFPGATWEIRVEAPAYVAPAPPRATGPARPAYLDRAADVCGRCGADVRKDQARMVLPPPLGSLSAAHPMTLCGPCNDGLVDLVAAYVAPAPPPATGPAADDPMMRPGTYCRPCDVFVGFGGAGVVRVPEDRADDREWLAGHCWMCKRSKEQIIAEDHAPRPVARHNGMEVRG